MLFNENDEVEVRKSRAGYSGPGKVLGLAHGSYYLVAVESEKWTGNRLVTVKFTDMTHAKASRVNKKRTSSKGEQEHG